MYGRYLSCPPKTYVHGVARGSAGTFRGHLPPTATFLGGFQRVTGLFCSTCSAASMLRPFWMRKSVQLAKNPIRGGVHTDLYSLESWQI
ncbi:hypothetical protein B0H10DRAFT_2080141 [Mycena sp. CBHHK59/15]|nr:hypothetical protein B0H10DRAFT_2080141 [Mycena sp. CBHHK59/15]